MTQKLENGNFLNKDLYKLRKLKHSSSLNYIINLINLTNNLFSVSGYNINYLPNYHK